MAIVTGGAQNLGPQHAIALAEAGAAIAICDLAEEAGRAVESELTALGSRTYFARVDVTKPEEIDRFVTETIACLGKIDILVNNDLLRRGFPSTKSATSNGITSSKQTCPACSTSASEWRCT